MDNKDIVEYIAITQPALEKRAAEKAKFDNALDSFLASHIKKGSFTKIEAGKIKKEAMENPSVIFKYVAPPVMERKLGEAIDHTETAPVAVSAFERALLGEI